MKEVKLTTDQKVEARISPANSAGEKITGKAKWSVVQGEGTVEVSKDGLSAFLISDETPGETVFLVECKVEGQDEPLYDNVKLVAFGSNAERLDLSVAQPISKSDKTELKANSTSGSKPITGVKPGPREK